MGLSVSCNQSFYFAKIERDAEIITLIKLMSMRQFSNKILSVFPYFNFSVIYEAHGMIAPTRKR